MRKRAAFFISDSCRLYFADTPIEKPPTVPFYIQFLTFQELFWFSAVSDRMEHKRQADRCIIQDHAKPKLNKKTACGQKEEAACAA